MMKKLMTMIFSTALTLSMSLCAFAGAWQLDAVGYWWQRDDGSYPAGGWEWIDDNGNGMAECYYFDPDGYCLVNTVTPDGCTVDANGAWIVDGVIQMQAATSDAQASDSKYNEYGLSYTAIDMINHSEAENNAKYPIASKTDVVTIYENGYIAEYASWYTYLTFPGSEFKYYDSTLTTAEAIGRQLAENGYRILDDATLEALDYNIPENSCMLDTEFDYVRVNAGGENAEFEWDPRHNPGELIIGYMWGTSPGVD